MTRGAHVPVQTLDEAEHWINQRSDEWWGTEGERL